MSYWEIRLAQQPSVLVEVDDERNLAAEYQQLMQQSWKWWYRVLGRQPITHWQVTDRLSLYLGQIIGVVPRERQVPRRRIGFMKGDA